MTLRGCRNQLRNSFRRGWDRVVSKDLAERPSRGNGELIFPKPVRGIILVGHRPLVMTRRPFRASLSVADHSERAARRGSIVTRP